MTEPPSEQLQRILEQTDKEWEEEARDPVLRRRRMRRRALGGELRHLELVVVVLVVGLVVRILFPWGMWRTPASEAITPWFSSLFAVGLAILGIQGFLVVRAYRRYRRELELPNAGGAKREPSRSPPS